MVAREMGEPQQTRSQTMSQQVPTAQEFQLGSNKEVAQPGVSQEGSVIVSTPPKICQRHPLLTRFGPGLQKNTKYVMALFSSCTTWNLTAWK